MENTNELSLKIQATCEEALKSLDKLISTMTKVDDAFSKVLKTVSKNTISETAKNASKDIDNMSIRTDKAYKSLTKLFTFAGAKRLMSTGLKWMEHSMDYSEALNLFNVVLDESTDKAIKFQNTMNEAFGTNMTETLTRQGLFQSMAENMGIASDYAYIMSENTTKLVNDISSLYNKKESTVAEALRAGIYAGQTKPLRSFGMDITEKTLQPELDRLGIDRTVRELSQAEKQLLRYISVLRQSREAQGDWANTIEAPANQLKILKNQLVEAQKALANLFINSFAKILPYANAILMVIEEVANAIASMFGIEITDYNTSIATAENAYIDLGDSIGDATKKAKELNKQTLGFDQINNINEKKDSGSGYDTSGGIDQRLLDAIHGYDNGMDKVRMKAIEIRDRIMEWLGFTKEIDPITGKTFFTYGGIKKTLSNMYKSFKGLSTQGKVLVGLGLLAGATKLLKVGNKLVKVFGTTGLGKVLKSLLSPALSLLNWTKLGVQVNGNLIGGLKDGITAWREQNILVKDASGNLNVFKTATNGLVVGLKGLFIAGTGFTIMHSSIKDIASEGANLLNVLGTISGSLMTIGGGALIGSIFGPWGTAIGATAGALISLYDIYMEFPTSTSKMVHSIEETTNELDKFNDSLAEQYNEINKTCIQNSALQDSYSALVSELENIVDKNGRVKKGYEERAKFIVTTLNQAYGTEIEMVNGVITKYQEQIQNIKDVINEKRKEIALESAEEAYKLAIENKAETYKSYTKAIKNNEDAIKAQKIAQEEYNKAYENWVISTSNGINIDFLASLNLNKKRKALEETTEAQKKASKELEDTTKSYEANVEAISNYTGLLSADVKKDSELVNEYINHIENSFKEGSEYVSLTREEQLEDATMFFSAQLKLAKTKGKEINDEWMSQAESRLNTLKTNLVDLTKTSEGELSENLIQAWATLGQTSEAKFLEYFKKLPKDLQSEVVDKMESKGYQMSENLQTGINQINPTIKVKTDTTQADKTIKIDADLSSAQKKTDSWWDRLVQNFKTSFAINISKLPFFADGGFPQTGQMFLAREAGPELVGQIGRKTAVANNEQIVQAVSSGVYNAVASAMSQMNGGSTVVDLNIRTEEGIIVEKAVKGIQQHVAQTGELPFTVPV